MDSLTQVVLGAAVGEAVLGRKVGNRAMLWGAIAGTIPDLDVFTRYFTDPVTATELHRGFSHSLVFCILMAPILGRLAHWIHNKREATWRGWTMLFFWALVTHPLLDAHTTWGTQFFWPFDLRLAYKNIFVVDPLYTLPFLVFTILAMLKKRTDPKRARLNHIGLIVSTSYMVLSLVLKGVTFTKFESALEEDKIAYVNMDTRPTPLNTVLWNAQVQTKNGFRMAYYSIFDSKPIHFSEEFPRNEHLIEPYKDQHVIDQLKRISAGWYMFQKEGDQLYYIDLRFGQLGFDPNESDFLWKFALTPDEDGQLNVEQIDPDMSKVGGFGDAMGDLWSRMKGN